MFLGFIDIASVYPCELVKKVLGQCPTAWRDAFAPLNAATRPVPNRLGQRWLSVGWASSVSGCEVASHSMRVSMSPSS